jgi:hypothetical protein
MRKDKDRHQNKRSLPVIALLVFVLTLLTSNFLVFQASSSTAFAAVTASNLEDELRARCTDKNFDFVDGNGNHAYSQDIVSKAPQACTNGFYAALKDNAIDPVLSKNGTKTECYTDDYPKSPDLAGICYTYGYVPAYKDRAALITLLKQNPSTTPEERLEREGRAKCEQAGAVPNNVDSGTCALGYVGAKNGDTYAETCGDLSGISKTYCRDGYNIGKGTFTSITDPGPDDPDNPDGTAQDDKQLDCDKQFTNALTWVLCPVVDALAYLVDQLDTLITNQMTIETDQIFCTSTSGCECTSTASGNKGNVCDAYHNAWSKFRDIALGLMVIAGLVIVIAQALGIEILDAYTIRKTLPRLLIAAVAITLSWPLMKFAVELTNDLGVGIRHLIYAPFDDLGTKLDFGGSITDKIFGSVLTIGAAATAVPLAGFTLAGGIGALLAYLGTAALAVFIAVIVLILRQVIIILLMLLAPVAIVAYILPNTAKLYKFWWESFSKALLMFPLIAAFIASGRVFAAVTLNNGGAFNQVIGFLAYFAPYFLIPLTFKFAGGFLRQLGGFVNDRGKGGFDRLRNFRGKRREAGWQRIKSGNLFRTAPGNSYKGRLNRAYGTAGQFNPDEVSLNPMNWRKESGSLRSRAIGVEAQKAFESDHMKPIMSNDDIGEAILLTDGSDAAVKKYISDKKGYIPDDFEQNMTHANLMRKQFGEEAFREAVFYSTLTSSTAFKGEEGRAQMLTAISNMSQGDGSKQARLVGKVKELAPRSGRTDLTAPFSDMFEWVRQIDKADGPQAKKQVATAAAQASMRTLLYTEGAGSVLSSKGSAVEAAIPYMKERLDMAGSAMATIKKNGGRPAPVQVVDKREGSKTKGQIIEKMMTAEEAQTEWQQSLAATAAYHDVLSQVSPEKANLVRDGVLTQSIEGLENNTTAMENIEANRNNPVFQQLRNDLRGSYEKRRLAQEQQFGQTGLGLSSSLPRIVGPPPPAA